MRCCRGRGEAIAIATKRDHETPRFIWFSVIYPVSFQQPLFSWPDSRTTSCFAKDFTLQKARSTELFEWSNGSRTAHLHIHIMIISSGSPSLRFPLNGWAFFGIHWRRPVRSLARPCVHCGLKPLCPRRRSFLRRGRLSRRTGSAGRVDPVQDDPLLGCPARPPGNDHSQEVRTHLRSAIRKGGTWTLWVRKWDMTP